jgi:hypothetical protein
MTFTEYVTMLATLVANICYVPLKSKIFHLRQVIMFICHLRRKRYRKLRVSLLCHLNRKRYRKLRVFLLCHLNRMRCRKLRVHLPLS